MYDFIQVKELFPFKDYLSKEILDKITPEIKWIAFGAFQQNVPLGICLASLDPIQNLLEILHLEVNEAHRNKGMGTTLLSKVEEEGIAQGASIFSFIYPLNTPETFIIEKILKTNQWKGTRPFLLRAKFNPQTFDAPMVHLSYQYPPGYIEFLWKALKPNQRKDLLYRQQQGHFSRAISPFSEEKSIEPLNSLGLEYQGRVVGWIITHRIDPETIRYSVIYIEPSLKFRGLAAKLLADAILIHMQNPTQWALIEIPYLLVPHSWIRFIEKRILPSAIQVTRYQQGWNTVF